MTATHTPPHTPPGERESEPPRGAPWDTPLADAPLAFFDLEMTGLDPSRDAIIEVAVTVEMGGRVVEQFETLVASAVGSTPAAARVHQIDGGALATAPPFE